MEDKRQRARVQGGWATPTKSQSAAQPATPARSRLSQRAGPAWRSKEQQLCDRQFVFKEPQLVVRAAPEPRVIDREGVYEISLSPTGVSRVCLYPGFVDLKEADWVLKRLCKDVPWKQRMGIREGKQASGVQLLLPSPHSNVFEFPILLNTAGLPKAQTGSGMPGRNHSLQRLRGQGEQTRERQDLREPRKPY